MATIAERAKKRKLTLDDLLGKLSNVQPTGDQQWKASCPAHTDRKPSLSIAAGTDKILMHCHAGCSTEKIVKAIRLDISDLFLNGGNDTLGDSHKRRRYATAHEAAASLKLGEPSQRWIYCDAAGNKVGFILRWDRPNGKEILPVSRNGDGWIVGGMSKPRPLYRLPELGEAKRVYVTEGEKAAEAARSLALTATTSPHGAKSAHKADWSPLAGKEVIILPDNDDAGRHYAQKVVRILATLKPTPVVKIVILDNLQEGGDIADWVLFWRDKGKTEEEMQGLIEHLADKAEASKSEPDDPSASSSQDNRREKKSVTTKLIEMTGGVELWHTPDFDAYATVLIGGHLENWPVRSKGFVYWLRHQFYLTEKKAPSSQAVSDALLLIEAKAIYEGSQYGVHVRTAEHEGDIYLDLCDDSWRAVRVTSEEWHVIDDPPVRFRRTKAMLPLSTPSEGGSVKDLRQFINVTDEDWPLVVSWLLAAMRPRGPYPVLALHGEQGSAKSTTARVLRELIGPNMAPLRCEPHDPRDLMIAASNSWILALDNMSHLHPWLSDALCRLSTGGGFATRELYTDRDEMIFDSQWPVIITGIEEVVTRGDLLDRSLLVSLPTIADEDRRPESKFWASFNKKKPGLLGAILTAVSNALANLPAVSLSTLPRMADFAVWATASERALGLREGEFMDAYVGNRQAANELVLESLPITRYIKDIVKQSGYWEGRAAELLKKLDSMASEGDKRLKSWPKTPRGLSGVLRRLAPNLRQAGIDVEFSVVGRGNQRRPIITIRRAGSKSERAGKSLTPPTPHIPGNEKLRKRWRKRDRERGRLG